MKTYHSQHGEDCFLEKFFEDQETGFYMDVGAFDGIHLSNTYLFDKKGWDGICVEAEPKYFKMCEANRTATCIHAAVVGDPNIKTVPFMVLDQEGIGSRLKTHMGKLRPKNKKRFTFTETPIKAVTLTDILRDTVGINKHIDLLSIDIEGEELNAFKGLDFMQYRPRVIVAEANTQPEWDKLNQFLVNTIGYQCAGEISVNKFYAITDEDVDRLRKIKVKCHIKTEHPTEKGSRSNRDQKFVAKLEGWKK